MFLAECTETFPIGCYKANPKLFGLALWNMETLFYASIYFITFMNCCYSLEYLYIYWIVPAVPLDLRKKQKSIGGNLLWLHQEQERFLFYFFPLVIYHSKELKKTTLD